MHTKACSWTLATLHLEKEGVVFLTYSTLVAGQLGGEGRKGGKKKKTRYEQL